MNEENIRKYAKLMKELELTGLQITENNSVVRLERNFSQMSIESTASISNNLNDVYKTSHGDIKENADAHSNYIVSPMVGIFYAAPTENGEAFVKAGDYVKKGDTLCIIEAMKLMNEIIAEQNGKILEVCVSNGEIVEFGSALFKMEGQGNE